jgi:CheY-like chemotaxis protein
MAEHILKDLFYRKPVTLKEFTAIRPGIVNQNPLFVLLIKAQKMIPENKKLILIVEDDPTSSLLYCSFLESKGFEVLSVTDGKEAIDAVIAHPDIQIILMDIRLPELDGVSTMKEIKKMRKDIPIIAQTAYAMVEDKDSLLKAGFDGYLSKPVKPDTLYNLLHSYLK